MRKILQFLFFITSGVTVCQENEILEKPVVDQRIELLSIVFRLAENREYSSKRFPLYINKIENHFNQYKNHDLIKYIKKNLKKRGIGYDAVMSMTISISSPPEFKPLIPFSKTLPDKRWSKKTAEDFLILLRTFYLDSNCKLFFKENSKLYQESSKRFINVYNNLDIDWYTKFYGEKPKGVFRIINALGNGGANYGPKIILNGEEVIYAIMGTWSVDSLGMPIYKIEDYFPTLLHEFNHSFVNHLIEKHHFEFSESGQIIFSEVKHQMKKQAYQSWETVYKESLVRASVIKYLKDHNLQVNEELNKQLNRGFIWTDNLVKELDKYSNNRETYPTLESFIPEIIKFFDKTALEINELKKVIDKRRPKVISISPFKNNSKNINYSITQIIVEFDRPLKGKGYSINYGEKGKSAYPEISKINYSKDKKSIIIYAHLKPSKEYQFVLTGLSFKTKEGFSMDNYEISFTTRKE